MNRLLLAFFVSFLGSAALQKVPDEVVEFMRRYGYLQRSAHNSFADITRAVKLMQRFGGLPETGMVDYRTLQLLKKPRCGVKDVNTPIPLLNRTKRYNVGDRWRKRRITYYVTSWPSQLSRETAMERVRQSFDAWSSVSPLRFIQVYDNNADIIILSASREHGDGYPFDGPQGVLAHAFFPNYDRYGGDAHFDGDEAWHDYRNNPHGSGIDYFTVAVHEFGHSLGLGHSDVPGSVMFPYYQGYNPNFELHDDDKMAMHKLYVENDDFDDEDPGSTEPTRRPTRPTDRPTRPTPSRPTIWPPTGRCSGSYDAITLFRNEFFIFKGRHMWRLRERSAEPSFEFHRLFHEFPSYVQRIDAIYERLTDSSLIFFTGIQYWEHDGYTLKGPIPLTTLGLPASLGSVDAAISLEDEKTYFFSGNNYWCYNEARRRMDPGYPKPISQLGGLPSYVDSAFKWRDHEMYFTKGNEFWKYDSYYGSAERMPYTASEYWLGCQDSSQHRCSLC